MKFKKGVLTLKEAISSPKRLTSGDTIAIELDNGKVFKLEVIKLDGENIMLSDEKNKFKIKLESLTKDNSKLPFQKISNDGKSNTLGSINAKSINQTSKSKPKNIVNSTGLKYGDVIRIDSEEKGPVVYTVDSVSDDYIDLVSDDFDITHYLPKDSDLKVGNKVKFLTAKDGPIILTIKSIESAERSKLDPNSMEIDGKLRVITKDGKILKFKITDVDNDFITVNNKDILYFINKDSISTYTDTGSIEYSVDGKDGKKKLLVKKIEYIPDNTSVDIEPEEPEEDEDSKLVDEERLLEITNEFNSLNKGDILKIMTSGGEISFKVESSTSGDLIADFIDANGYGDEIKKELKLWDDIIFNTADFEVYEGDDLIKVLFIGFSGKNKKSYTMSKVSGFDYEITADNKAKKGVVPLGANFIKGFYDTLSDMDGDAVLELKMEDGDKYNLLYLEPVNTHYDGEKVIFNVLDRKGLVSNFYSNLETLIDSDKLLVDNNSLKINDDTNKGVLSITNENGAKIMINGITGYKIDNRTKDVIKDLEELSDEDIERALFNDATLQDTMIGNRGLFAKLFGKDKLGWISAIKQTNNDRYGEGYSSLSKGNYVYFTFTDKVKAPYSKGKTLKGQMVEKDKIRIKSKVNNSSKVYMTEIKLISGGPEENSYNVEVDTNEINNNVVDNKKIYKSIVLIKNYNA